MSNLAAQIATSFGRGVDKLIGAIGKWGSASPADDSKSGIKIGDEIYQVVVSLNGCYWYIDKEGKKQNISSIPKDTEWEWVNIQEKVLQDFRTCYRTLGGKVDIWSWYLLNDQLEVLKETHKVTDSTDLDNPIGTILEKIPEDWKMMDCDLPDMTERDVTPINRCYSTPGGKVNVEGLESIDGKNTVRAAIYSILQSTDPNYPVGTEMTVIPGEWNRMVCDFPDMTQRQILSVNECYTTPGGKIHLGGYRIKDALGDNRKEYFIVSQSTDPDIEVNSVFDSIDPAWSQIVCDFADQTTADTEAVENCYDTDGGKIQVRTYIVFDGNGKARTDRSIVMRTTDPTYNIGQEIDQLPASWRSSECDFASLTERHAIVLEKCFITTGGKIKADVISIIDNNMDFEVVNVIVKESTDPNIHVDQVFDSIQMDWMPSECDLPSLSERHLYEVEECYQSADGSVYVEGYKIVDNKANVESMKLTVLETTIASIPVATQWESIPEGFTRIACKCNCGE